MLKAYIINFLMIVILFSFQFPLYGTNWYVSPNGNDLNSGNLNSPFKSLKHAILKAEVGDIIELRNGIYTSDEIKIEIDNLTIRSYQSEWAIIKAPIDKGEEIASCLWYSNEKTRGGTLQRLEIIGGAFYGVKFESNWNWGLPNNQRSGASGIKLIQCKIHDTGRDCIKIAPGCNDISIISCEIYNSGIGPENSEQNGGPNAEGIDNVNGSRMMVQNCYFHDISTNGLYAKGGAVGCIIEGNLFRNMGEAGIGVGFYTDGEWFDENTNPKYYESINTIVRNNIVINTKHGGIVIVGAKGCKIYNNTIVTASLIYHAPLTFLSGEVGIDENITFHPVSSDLLIINNIFVDLSPSGDEDYTMLIRKNALEGNNVIDHNIYYKSNGKPILFDDGDWPVKKFNDWKARGYDTHGYQIDPLMNSEMNLASNSPAVDKGKFISELINDYDGKPRIGAIDIGANEFGNGTPLPLPPPSSVIGTGAQGITSAIDGKIINEPKVIYYPNPADKSVTINMSGCENCKFQLLDIAGNLVATSQDSVIQTEKLMEGFYFIKMMNSSNKISNSQKIIIYHPK